MGEDNYNEVLFLIIQSVHWSTTDFVPSSTCSCGRTASPWTRSSSGCPTSSIFHSTHQGPEGEVFTSWEYKDDPFRCVNFYDRQIFCVKCNFQQSKQHFDTSTPQHWLDGDFISIMVKMKHLLASTLRTEFFSTNIPTRARGQSLKRHDEKYMKWYE